MFGGRQRKDSRGRRKSGIKLDELVLVNAKLRFCPDQLLNLNYIFNKKLQNPSQRTDKSLMLARSVTERLVQRLVCGAGMLDSRFASKYLINNYEQQDSTSNLCYTVRLDCLSTPRLYRSDPFPKYSVFESESDYPAGYARVKLYGGSLKMWSDFVNSSGYLRRDKVQARFVELLASAASKEIPGSPLNVDESIHCGIPGKVVDNYTFYNILKIPPEKHVYYGPGGNVPRFPDTRDFRLAIVDEPDGVRLKVEFLSPALSNVTIDVRILVAIGIDAWPSSTDFPSRVSLGHPDCLLYQQAAETGMFLVGYGVQSSAWQMRLPAAEAVVLNHYGSNSTVKTVLDVLYMILDEIDSSRKLRKQQMSYKILTRYMFLTLLLEELEENSIDPISDMINWSPMYLSTHVLNLLDKTIQSLKAEKHPNYFFKKANLLLNPGHLCDDDFTTEANNIKNALIRFFDESLISTDGNEEFDKIVSSQESELNLLKKWKDLIEGLLPPSGTRGRRFCFAGSKNKQDVAHTQYTLRQLEYVGLLLKKMLKVRQSILQVDQPVMESDPNLESLQHDTAIEDLIFVLVTIMDQARDQYLSKQTNPNILKNRLKIKSNFNTYTSKLIDQMRRDRELLTTDYEEDLMLVKTILKWLYRAMDQNKRYLGPILRPYLNNIFSSSHAISWHIDAIKERTNNDEIRALSSFATLVNDNKITPAQGLIDCVNKNWCWAKSMLGMVEKNTLRVIFISDRGHVYRHILSLPSYQRNDAGNGSKTLEIAKKKREIKRQKTLPNRSYFNTLLNEKSEGNDDDAAPQHDRLRNASPLSLIMNKRHRRGEHRGVGDVFKALTSMQKLNMFQEVASNLPQEARNELTELIQNVQSVKAKKTTTKRWSGTLPQMNRVGPKGEETVQRYIPKEESAGIRIKDEAAKKQDDENKNGRSLLETCRAVRIKEDSGVFYLHDSFKVKSLLNKSNSFRNC